MAGGAVATWVDRHLRSKSDLNLPEGSVLNNPLARIGQKQSARNNRPQTIHLKQSSLSNRPQAIDHGQPTANNRPRKTSRGQPVTNNRARTPYWRQVTGDRLIATPDLLLSLGWDFRSVAVPAAESYRGEKGHEAHRKAHRKASRSVH